MCTTLRGKLPVHKTVILFTILVFMCYSNFNIFCLLNE